MIHDPVKLFLESDPYLKHYEKVIRRRLDKIAEMIKLLTGDKISLADFSSGHEYFGLHFSRNEWIFREWAPNADAIYLIGDMTDWLENKRYALERVDKDGVWEIRLPSNSLGHGDLYRLRVHWPGGQGDRIPAWVRRVVQDPDTLIFNAQVWLPSEPYTWQCINFRPSNEAPLVYEVHVGMAQEEEKIGSYREFTRQTLPRILDAGYNTLQLMAIQEHPYYGSFGYQVSNFFAASSRFGPPEAAKKFETW